jgi:hypothetical protein
LLRLIKRSYFLLIKRSDQSATASPISFPNGIGMFIALECFRETASQDCVELITKEMNSKQGACKEVCLEQQIKRTVLFGVLT